MTSAFRHLPIKKLHWKFLVMKAKSPLDGKTYYFFDKCLPFGSAISCALFQKFSDAISYLVEYLTKMVNLNYLDDFWFTDYTRIRCNKQINTFLKVCADINFPVSLEKTFWGCTVLTFLGLRIDVYRQLVSIPLEKVQRALAMIQFVLDKKR